MEVEPVYIWLSVPIVALTANSVLVIVKRLK